jgi:hypothetical protein
MKIKAEIIHHERGEPYMSMDLLSENRYSIWFRIRWLLRCWRKLEITVTVIKEAGKRL